MLVQREMEYGRSPLASIARASAEVDPTGEEKKNPESRVPGAFQRDAAQGIGGSLAPREVDLRGWPGSTSGWRDPLRAAADAISAGRRLPVNLQLLPNGRPSGIE